jgi:D-inositol-3-phosphate glycosyltransferase
MRSDKLKIAMLSVHSCPVGKLGSKDTGGMSVYIRELARELGQRGHTVDIYTRATTPLRRRLCNSAILRGLSTCRWVRSSL